eukprot:9061813-Ditylum_brightwellii.AAC.1
MPHDVVSSAVQCRAVSSGIVEDSDIDNKYDHQRQRPQINYPSRREMIHATTAVASACCINAAAPKAVLADDNSNVEAKSPFIALTKNLIQDNESAKSTMTTSNANPLDIIDWNGPKKRGLNMEQMADAINDGLVEQEWFVTGIGKPELFSPNFTFTDPDVSLAGYESYCRAVRKLFDQNTA